MDEQRQTDTLIEFGPFTLDKALGKLSKHGTPIRLGGMPLKILQQLVERPGEVVSRGELRHLLWNGAAFGGFEQGLNSAVNVVRKSLSDSADQPRYVETVPGSGYRFIAPLRSAVAVRETHASSPALDACSMAADANQAIESGREIRDASVSGKATAPVSRWWIAGALAMTALGGGAWRAFQGKPEALIDGVKLSANHGANDQYNLAMNFLAYQNDIPRIRDAFPQAMPEPVPACPRLDRPS